MSDLLRALPHLLMALAVIAAVSTLAALGIVTGGEALPIIAAAGGFTLGGTVASVSVSGLGAGVSGVSSSRPATPLISPIPFRKPDNAETQAPKSPPAAAPAEAPASPETEASRPASAAEAPATAGSA